MDKDRIIRAAASIRNAAGHVCVAGPNNWAQLLGIIRAAEEIIVLAQKEDEHGE